MLIARLNYDMLFLKLRISPYHCWNFVQLKKPQFNESCVRVLGNRILLQIEYINGRISLTGLESESFC